MLTLVDEKLTELAAKPTPEAVMLTFWRAIWEAFRVISNELMYHGIILTFKSWGSENVLFTQARGKSTLTGVHSFVFSSRQEQLDWHLYMNLEVKLLLFTVRVCIDVMKVSAAVNLVESSIWMGPSARMMS